MKMRQQLHLKINWNAIYLHFRMCTFDEAVLELVSVLEAGNDGCLNLRQYRIIKHLLIFQMLEPIVFEDLARRQLLHPGIEVARPQHIGITVLIRLLVVV